MRKLVGFELKTKIEYANEITKDLFYNSVVIDCEVRHELTDMIDSKDNIKASKCEIL